MNSCSIIITICLCLSLMVSGCASQLKHYTDPLNAFGNSPGPSPYSVLDLGVVLSGNFYAASKQLQDQQHFAQSLGPLLTNPSYVDDIDAQFIHSSLNKILVKRFSHVYALKDRSLIEKADVDLAVILNLNVSVGSISGTKSSVYISGDFIDSTGSHLETVEANGISTVPFPAFTANVKTAAIDALETFAENLDSSQKIQAFALNAPARRRVRTPVVLPEPQGPPTTIAVADIAVPDEFSPSTMAALSDQLRSVLLNTGYFTVLGRNDMQRVLDEQSFQFSMASADVDKLVELGRMLPAQKIIGGALGKVGKTYTLTLRLVDIETGRIEHMVNEHTEAGPDELISIIDHAAKTLAKKFAESL